MKTTAKNTVDIVIKDIPDCVLEIITDRAEDGSPESVYSIAERSVSLV